MTTRTRALLAVLATFVTTFVVGTTTAHAATPVGPDWPVPEPTSTLDLIVFFGGSTVGLFVVIWLLALLTARNNYVPPAPTAEVEKADTHH